MNIPNTELTNRKISISHLDDEEGTYRTYLNATDYEIIKGFENLISSSSLTEFFTNLRALNVTLRDTIQYRQIARDYLDGLEVITPSYESSSGVPIEENFPEVIEEELN